MELSNCEARALIDQIAEINPGIFVITGGDPVLRPDLLSLVRYATDQGLRVAFSPSATPRLLRTDFREFVTAGVKRMSLSLDGPDEDSHDQFRGVRGTWRRTIEAIGRARACGLPFQINTTITRSNIGQFDAFAALMDDLQPELWSVFLIVPTGRAQMEEVPTADQVEYFFEKLAAHAAGVSYAAKTTEGQHYRRVLLQNGGAKNERGGNLIAPAGINDGKGFVFISHTGMICPSGFLPLEAGSVRCNSLLGVYRTHVLFTMLRDRDQLKGKCGLCEFNNVCGGSRARAYAMMGDVMAQEPLCNYQPTRAALLS